MIGNNLSEKRDESDESVKANTGRLNVRRIEELSNGFRKYCISVDGHKIGVVKPGETISVNLPPGNYNVTTSLGMCSSEPVNVTIQKNKVITLETGSTLGIGDIVTGGIFGFVCNIVTIFRRGWFYIKISPQQDIY